MAGVSDHQARTIARQVMAGANTTITSLTGLDDGSLAAPSIAYSADTDTGLRRAAADTVEVVAGGATGLQVTGAATAVNYLDVQNAATGGAPALAAEGTDTNIGLTLTPKGTGAITLGGAVTVSGALSLATAASTPAQNAAYQQGIAKAWVKVNGSTGATISSFNITSTSRTATGAYTVTWDRDFSSVDYVVQICASTTVNWRVATQAAGSITIETFNASGAATDAGVLYVVAYGDQAA